MLAAIGIVIGVVAIASMGMLGTNMQLEVKDQLSSSANTDRHIRRFCQDGSGRDPAALIRGNRNYQKRTHEDQLGRRDRTAR